MRKATPGIGLVVSHCLIVLLISLFVSSAAVWADEGATSGFQNTSSADTSGLVNRTIDRVGSAFGRLFGVENLFSELSVADVGHKSRIKPHIAFNQGFVSNARLGSNQADAAWQARIAPGISVSIPSGKLSTEVDYTYAFSTTQGRKTNESVNTHNLNAIARYDLSADTVLGVGNNIQLSQVPGEGGDTFILETAVAQAKHRLGEKLSASLTDTYQWFKDQTESGKSHENDFHDNGVAAALSYDATSDLSVGPSFTWNVRDFKNRDTKDYWQMLPSLIASYRLGPKTTVGGNFGWAFRRFDDRGVTTSGRTESELVYGVSVSHKYGRKLVWTTSYSKSLQDTFDTNFVFRDTPESVALDNLDRDFRVIKSHRFGSAVTYNLNEKNSFGVWGDFSLLSGDQDDNIATNLSGRSSRKNDEKSMEVGARYSYRFTRYLAFDVLYAFGRRFTTDNNRTNDNRNDYTFHKVTGGVNIAV